MQEVNCYNCHSNKNTFYASENGFTLVKCDQCGLLFVNPRPTDEEIEQAHRLGVHRGSETLNMTGSFSPTKVSMYLEILEDMFEDRTTLNKKTWLDLGCGHGEFILALQEFSNGQVIAEGLEPNIYKQKSAREKGLAVSYFDLSKQSVKYDVISFLNVYSHLPDPPTTIAAWKRLLNPNGELLLETGDTAHFKSKDHYKPFCLPDHLSFASERVVADILDRVGFNVICIRKYPYLKLSSFGILRETVKLFWPNKKSRLKYMMKHKMYASTDMYIRAVQR